MKRRLWKFAMLLLVPIGLGIYLVGRNSWRPRTIRIASQPVYLGGEFSPDGRCFVVRVSPIRRKDYLKSEIVIWDVQEKRIMARLKGKQYIFVAKGRYIATSYSDGFTGNTRIYSLTDGKLIAQSPPHFIAYRVLSDEMTFVGTSWKKVRDQKIYAWDVTKPQSLKLLGNVPFDLFGRANILADGTTALVWKQTNEHESNEPYTELGDLFLWDIRGNKRSFTLATNRQWAEFDSTKNGILAVAQTNDYERNHHIDIWNYKTGRLMKTIRTTIYPGQILTMENGFDSQTSGKQMSQFSLSADGRFLTGYDGFLNWIGIWNTTTGQLNRIQYSPTHIDDTAQTYAVQQGRKIELRETASRKLLWSYDDSRARLAYSPIAISPKRNYIIGVYRENGTSDGTIRLWCLK